MEPALPPNRRRELAATLRALRERTPPAAVGLSAAGARRTPGLRREEVAMLAGVSVAWYTWLEQGREIRPSAEVLDALARNLGVSAAERTRLFALAGVTPTDPAPSCPDAAPLALRETVRALHPSPAFLLNARTDVLAWNTSARVLLGTPSQAPDGARNLLWWLFTRASGLGGDGEVGAARVNDGRMRGEDRVARRLLTQFRVEHARRYDDPSFRALIVSLLGASADFRHLWSRRDIADVGARGSGAKRIEHPRLGPLALRHVHSVPAEHDGLSLVQLVPADEATRRALACG